MIRQSIYAWKILMLSLPKGIIAFVIAVTGLSASLPLIIVWVGLPLLALTLAWCRRMMSGEHKVIEAWSSGNSRRGAGQPAAADHAPAFHWEGLRTLGHQLRERESYRGILYSLLQLPAGILGFTLALVLPTVAFSALLSPLAQRISASIFSYDLNMLDPEFFFFLSGTTSDERSWILCGTGFVLLLILPLLLVGLGRLYAAWISAVSGTHVNSSNTPLEVIHT
ncbi:MULTISPECIES: sensor domain-containing protein [unclassified Paenibacillus]|uniref:sensor domain-containing protein n=1 Tax=unclassified Paenibacillus TaxID=185978 RepID=UPI0009F81419|nr:MULTISPECIES: sensor domain-containing protein [unclassified Paenibacillus]